MSDQRREHDVTAPPAFRWTAAKHAAALAVALDERTDAEIAAEAGVTRQGLQKWKNHPDFARRVAELVEEAGTAASRYAIGRKTRRIRSMNERWLSLQAVIEARAADPDHAALPGGATGLLARRVRVIGTGEHQQTVEEAELDAALLKELRELERAAALELNQIETPRPAGPPDDLAPMFDREEDDAPLYAPHVTDAVARREPREGGEQVPQAETP